MTPRLFLVVNHHRVTPAVMALAEARERAREHQRIRKTLRGRFRRWWRWNGDAAKLALQAALVIGAALAVLLWGME